MEVKSGFKQTEVGIFPEDWTVSALSAVCSMKSGEAITATTIDQHSQYPCYGGNGLRGYTSRYTHSGTFALIGRQGALCGNVVGVTGTFFASEHAVVVTARDGTDIRFLTYVLGEMHLNRLSEASAQPGLSVSKILQLSIGIPRSEAEQRAIAEALGDVDALLASLDRLIAKKRDIKQAVMQQLLTGKTRLPRFSGEWEMKRLADLFTFRNGVNADKEAYGQGTRFINVLEPITYSHIHGPEIIGRVSLPTAIIDSYSVCRGDVLFNRTSETQDEVALAAVYLGSEQVVFGGFVIRGRPLGEHFDPMYSGYALRAPFVRSQIIPMGQGAVRANVGQQNLGGVLVPLPPLSEQRAIAEVLADMDAEVDTLVARRDKSRSIKQGMMQELLTGRTRLV